MQKKKTGRLMTTIDVDRDSEQIVASGKKADHTNVGVSSVRILMLTIIHQV
jgi:hypothetical protein